MGLQEFDRASGIGRRVASSATWRPSMKSSKPVVLVGPCGPRPASFMSVGRRWWQLERGHRL